MLITGNAPLKSEATIVGVGEVEPTYKSIYARTSKHTNNVQIIISPQENLFLEIIKNLLYGSYISLVHKDLYDREIEVSKIKLESSIIKLILKKDNTIQITVSNPIYVTNLFVNYHFINTSMTYTGQTPVLLLDDTEKSNAVPIDNRHEKLDKPPNPSEEYIVTPFEPVLMLNVNFNSYVPIEYGIGEVEYIGGGNRFVQTKNNKLVIQQENDNPMYNEYNAYSEIEINNLIKNDFLEGLPVGYVIEPNDNLIFESASFPHEKVTGANVLQILVYDSKEINQSLKINTPTVPINPANPISFSSYIGIKSEDVLKTISFNFIFYNNSTLLGTITKEFDPSMLINDLGILFHGIKPDEIPVGSNNIKVQIKFDGIDKGERFTLQLLLPQLVPYLIQTTPILNDNTRKADVYTIQQNNNISLSAGTIEITYVPSNGITPSTLFDTTLLGTNGFKLNIMEGNKIEFIINKEGTNYVLITQGVNFVQGINIIRVEWNERGIKRGIYYNNKKILENTATFETPIVMNDKIYIGNDSNSLNQINGKLERFKIYGVGEIQ